MSQLSVPDHSDLVIPPGMLGLFTADHGNEILVAWAASFTDARALFDNAVGEQAEGVTFLNSRMAHVFLQRQGDALPVRYLNDAPEEALRYRVDV